VVAVGDSAVNDDVDMSASALTWMPHSRRELALLGTARIDHLHVAVAVKVHDHDDDHVNADDSGRN
jgi:hypothetical protein